MNVTRTGSSPRRGRHRRPSSSRKNALLGGLAAATAAGAVLLAWSGSTADAAPAGTLAAASTACHDIDVPVTSGALAAHIHATLCAPRGAHADVPLQVLVPGGTYNRTYWSNLGAGGDSYVTHATAAGYATLAIDRIGTGGSTQPPSAVVTGTVQADAVHQVIAAARAGKLPGDGQHYGQVALVGHSLGSMISTMVAGAHPRDVDAVVLTGYSHTVSQDAINASLAAMHPAAEEGRPLDPGYLTTVPGIRPSIFHAAGDSDASITGREEAMKDVGSTAELADAASVGTAAATSRAITAPVLEVNGGKDSWGCAAVDCSSAAAFRAAEQPDYSRPLSTFIQPEAGHAVTLAADREPVLEAITGFLDTALHHAHHTGDH